MRGLGLFRLRKCFFHWFVVLLIGCSSLPARTPNLRYFPSAQSLKITALPDAMVAIPIGRLEPFGFDPSSPAEWVLSFRGHVLPFWILGDDQPKLIFYSPPTRSLYWGENVLLLQPRSSFDLTADPGLSDWLQQPEWSAINFGQAKPTTGAVLGYLFFEQDRIYQPAAEGEHWFWQRLVNGQMQEWVVNFESPPLGEVLVRLSLYSASEAPQRPDHVLQVTVNGTPLRKLFWDGRGYRKEDLAAPAGLFRKGENRLELSVPELEEVPAQMVYLDKIEIYSWQNFPVQADQSKFLAKDESELVAMENFGRDYWIWRLDNPLQPEKLEREERASAAVEYRGYLYVSRRGFQAPSDLRPIRRETEPTQGESDTEYIIIGAEDLLRPLRPLLDLRRNEGLVVKTVEVEEIYAQFYGFSEPQSARAYLARAARSYPSLRYGLLVGDATYDPKQNVTSAALNRLPTFFIETTFGGQTSTELPFALLTQENLEFLDTEARFELNLAVGRLPASSPEQVRRWVSKVIEYERGEKRPKANTLLAVADPYEAYFAQEASEFIRLWDSEVRGELFSPTPGELGTSQAIQRYFGQEFQMIAYFGHGAIDLWGKDEIFSAREAATLAGQASYPLVLSFTCLTGYYIHPEVMSVSEALLWNSEGGAILVIAPTSLTLASDQSFLWKAWVESYRSGAGGRIGDVWVSALSRVQLQNKGVREVVATYTLFGDPAMTLP